MDTFHFFPLHVLAIILLICCSVYKLCPTLCNCPDCSSGVCSNSCPLSQWCYPTISSSVTPFSSCFQSFPASGSFPMSQTFTLDGQSIGASASASVLPMNIQVWFLLGLTDLPSLLFNGLSRVFSSTTIWKHQFFGAQPSLWSNSQVILLMGVCRCSGWCPVLEPTVAMVMAINILFLNKH